MMKARVQSQLLLLVNVVCKWLPCYQCKPLSRHGGVARFADGSRLILPFSSTLNRCVRAHVCCFLGFSLAQSIVHLLLQCVCVGRGWGRLPWGLKNNVAEFYSGKPP